MEREKETVEHEVVPEIWVRTPRMQIRRFAQSEWLSLLAYLQDDGIADGFPEGAYTESRLRDLTADPYLYALVSEDEVMGHAYCRPGIHPRTGELGIGIRSDYRRHGYASEAMQALLRQSFFDLALHRVTVSCPPENLALRALLERIGMRMEAFFRQSMPTVDGEWKDECVYAMLRDEWRVQERLLQLKEQEETEDSAASELVATATLAQTNEEPAPQAPDFEQEHAEAWADEIQEPYFAQPEADPDVPQVTLTIGGGSAPFAPILPPPLELPNPLNLAEGVEISGTVVGVQKASQPDPLGGLIEQRIDGVGFVLKRPHDFNWLAPFGRVFRVWDRQDSGNMAFGLNIEDQQVFIKYAGAATAEYKGHPFDAVRRLRTAAEAYEVLRHPALVRILDHFDTQDGYAILFEWASGELLRADLDQRQGSGYAQSAIARFRRLPIEERIDAMESILDFHAHVEAFGYVAIDFYDGSLIYDFEQKRITICDIDLYHPTPYTNEMGRMWGSSRFMSPEEYELGAPIDSRTNVYNMGAMAFFLLGGEADHSRELWEASDELYEAALRAVSPDRGERWETVAELLEVWRQL